MERNSNLNSIAIAKARNEKKLSQQDVANALGISQPAYHNIETGYTQRLRNDHVCKLSEILGIPVEKILKNEGADDKLVQYNQNNDLKDSTIIHSQYNELNETLLNNLLKAKDEITLAQQEIIKAKDETIATQKETILNMQGMFIQLKEAMAKISK